MAKSPSASDVVYHQHMVHVDQSAIGASYNFILPPDNEDVPEKNEDGQFNIAIREPAIEPGHLAIGRFMESWSRLERVVSALLQGILGVDSAVMPALMNGLGSRNQNELLASLGEALLDDTANAKLMPLLDAMKKMNTKRNRIVHGYWMLETVVSRTNGRLVVRTRNFRAYTPNSPQLAAKIHDPKNRKDRSAYLFSPDSIEKLASATDDLKTRFSDFMGQLLSGKGAQ